MARAALFILALLTLPGCAQPGERGARVGAPMKRANLIDNDDLERSNAGPIA